MGHHVFCAFCGAGFSDGRPYTYGDEELGGDFGCELGDFLDRDLIKLEDLQWMPGARVLTRQTLDVERYFVTGFGYADDGFVVCQSGDEAAAAGQAKPTDDMFISVYCPERTNFGESTAFPFHNPCFCIFAKVLKQKLNLADLRMGSEDTDIVDRRLLHRAMAECWTDWESHLELDYGEMNLCVQDQYFAILPGFEAYYMDPLNDHRISEYFSTFETSPKFKRKNIQEQEIISTSPSNILDKLFDDLILEICLLLPFSDLQNLILSSLIKTHLPFFPSFWIRRIKFDLPFLWDFPWRKLNGARDLNLDWMSVYRDLRKMSFATLPEKAYKEEGFWWRVDRRKRDMSLVLPVGNRRRVWGTCAQLVEKYVGGLEAGERGDEVRIVAEE